VTENSLANSRTAATDYNWWFLDGVKPTDLFEDNLSTAVLPLVVCPRGIM